MIYFKIRVSLVEQELPTLREDLSSTRVFSGVRVTRSFVLDVVFCICSFVLFHLTIALSILVLVSSHSSLYKVNKQQSYSTLRMNKGPVRMH